MMYILSFMRIAFLFAWLFDPANSSPLLSHQLETLAGPTSTPLRRQSSGDGNGTFAITGITDFGTQPRLEIRELEKNRDAWNIYLLGLERFKAAPQDDKLSYYKLAGIHGRPYEPWDGVFAGPGIDNPGYCAHISNLFLPWHRPYLVLFEQILFEHIVDAVNEFPAGSVRQRYASAALSWRMPYWDWAVEPEDGLSVYPDIITSPTVEVTYPNGTRTIDNPLYSYKFHPVSARDMFFDPFASWNETKRFPTAWTNNAASQDNLIGPILDNSRVSFMNRLYNLFTYYDNFTQFGTEVWQTDDIANADSIESLHDAIHSITGGNGHMTFLDYSAFDPIFWLHHTQMDRIFALWQVLHPDSYVEPLVAITQTYTVHIGDTEDANSPLEPFSKDTLGNKFTSNDVRFTTQFGYTYPELAGNASLSSVRTAINRLYGSNANSGGPLKRRDTTTLPHDKRFVKAASADDVRASPGMLVNGHLRQYAANIVSQKHALNGSYAVYVFMGDFTDDPCQWALSPNLAGTHAVAANLELKKAPGVSKMVETNPIRVGAALPLTDMLLMKVRAGELKSMEMGDVEPYLRENLHWRVSTFDNVEVDLNDVADLSITVVSAEVTPPTCESEFPSRGNFTLLTHITKDRVGGC
ncbi:unnamed protein product [Zymoseptoria tritici ST99CH_3D7]|uniref:tyrosinase n=1 Tax=Zymoseptoria tritici (strain ST99CH_3D7) TaxID=1276538 RepID=A0A1X7RWC6_ZYMT9|nr:unnamed protein product [Zymoseptoria tritici ST99CH_3D7]